MERSLKRQNPVRRKPARRIWVATGVAMTLLSASCSTVTPEQGRERVDALLATQLIPNTSALADDEPSVDARRAVEIALAQNTTLQVRYAELTQAIAQHNRDARPPNPVVELTRLGRSEGDARHPTSVSIALSLLSLIGQPQRARVAQLELDRAIAELAHNTLGVAMAVQTAYVHHAKAYQAAQIQARMAEAAQIGYELTQAFHDAGNVTQRELLAARAEASEAKLQALDAEWSSIEARESLLRVMGVRSAAISLDHGLPLPDPALPALPQALQQSQSRFDLRALQVQAQTDAQAMGFERWASWFADWEIGWEWEREGDGTRKDGPELSLPLPLFSVGAEARLAAQANVEASRARLEQLAQTVDYEVRTSTARLANAFERFNEYEQDLLPTMRQMTERAQEEQNYMLIGVFELLELKAQEMAAELERMHALADYWHARVELANAVGSYHPLPEAENPGDRTPTEQPRTAPHHHHHHHQNQGAR